ncbi:putative O-glycosylation ligase, exosortase A system-associated [Rhodanobacter sp. AS-Z3]|uniref:putative O-glycosylation ligase, exosortase A system-associated n=1 Tax=Rhodanobacter sp. AS-Z3 TaxID=3031330 RepID=UPI002478AEB9|nr:putative O-glycosylation ligase, exosortase A system-associated [Rhodanobacter sp. AS-Z3]WEN15372.1 putative O-glycosylation ligase, exosortase A system-associated [Rhodanobacter sp. AS-Z3]
MRDILLALFIFGMLPYVLVRPYVGLLIWSWLGYMNPNRLCYGFAISFPWVQLVALVTLLSFLLSKESKKIPWSTTSVLLVTFLFWTTLTTAFAVVPGSAWDAWLEFAKILVMVFVTLALVTTRERMHGLVWIMVVSLGYYGFRGGLFTILGGGADHVVGPPGSFITDNNALALALCMTLPLMRYLQLHSSRKFVRLGLTAGMLFTGIAVLGTYSRGGLIALAIVSAALFLKSRGRLAVIVIAVAIGFVAYHFMPPEWTARMGTLQNASQTDSGESRIQSWKFAANVAIHHPLLGGGFNDYESTSLWEAFAPEGAKQRAIHSIYFRVLSEQGFPGLILFLALFVTSWRGCNRIRKKTRNSPEQRWAFDLASMLQVALVAYLAAGAFLPMTYFDLTYQLMALCVLLEYYGLQKASPLAEESHYGDGLPARPNPMQNALPE